MVNYPPGRRFLPALLRVPHLAFVGGIHAGLVAAGITDINPAHLVVFQHIAREGSRSTVLAEKAHMTKQSMGYLVDYLEERGYVERVEDPTDRRARLVRLTDQGWRVMVISREVVMRMEAEWAEFLGEKQFEDLIHILQQLVTMLGEPVTF